MHYEVTMELLQDNLPLDTTDAQFDTVYDIFKELYTLCHFGEEGETAAKNLQKIDDSMNIHRKALLKLIEDNHLTMTYSELVQQLEKPMKLSRMEARYTQRTNQYSQTLDDAGFLYAEKRAILAKIKKYMKNPEINPFL